MGDLQAPLAFFLASAIGAELLLFAAFLLSKPRRDAALYLLAALAVLLAGIIMANLAIGIGAWRGLGDAVLFADLCVPVVAYLYVRQVGRDGPALGRRDLIHALPPVLGIGVWAAGLMPSMDAYVIGCWISYLGAAVYRFTLFSKDCPPGQRRFAGALLGVLGMVVLLRVIMVFDSGIATPFLEGVPYLMVLVITFAATCLLLFATLRSPDFPGGDQGHPKYLQSPVSETELRALEVRLAEHLDLHKPYLDPDLTLSGLAARLDAPTRHVSQLVNVRFGLNVPAYLNRRRIDEAVRLLTDNPDTPIKVVMFKAGFRSKSIFNREFQRCVGVNPSTFRQGLRNADPQVNRLEG